MKNKGQRWPIVNRLVTYVKHSAYIRLENVFIGVLSSLNSRDFARAKQDPHFDKLAREKQNTELFIRWSVRTAV